MMILRTDPLKPLEPLPSLSSKDKDLVDHIVSTMGSRIVRAMGYENIPSESRLKRVGFRMPRLISDEAIRAFIINSDPHRSISHTSRVSRITEESSVNVSTIPELSLPSPFELLGTPDIVNAHLILSRPMQEPSTLLN